MELVSGTPIVPEHRLPHLPSATPGVVPNPSALLGCFGLHPYRDGRRHVKTASEHSRPGLWVVHRCRGRGAE